MAIKLKGTGRALPDRVVTNEELATLWTPVTNGSEREPVLAADMFLPEKQWLIWL